MSNITVRKIEEKDNDVGPMRHIGYARNKWEKIAAMRRYIPS